MQKTTRKRRKPKTTAAGRSIVRGLKEILDALKSGKRLTGRIYPGPVKVPDPGRYDPAAVAATRRKLQVSQPVFAELMGVSLILAQSWEQGKRVPHATARRLLDEINREPKRWAGMIVSKAA